MVGLFDFCWSLLSGLCSVEARIKAYKQIDTNPNTYYYRFNAPGEAQRNGPWNEVKNIHLSTTSLSAQMNEWFWEKETVYERARDGKRERERERWETAAWKRGAESSRPKKEVSREGRQGKKEALK